MSNLKQLGIGSLAYVQDYDETYPSDSGSGARWGTYYWMFLFKPYISAAPANFNKQPTSIFYCPSDPSTIPMYLDVSDPDDVVKPAPEILAAWGIDTLTQDEDGNEAIGYWASYAVNENVTEQPAIALWEAPASSYLYLEANDSEVEGDELDELWGLPGNVRAPGGGHNEGGNICFLDAHVKWYKYTFRGNPADEDSLGTRANWIVPTGRNGGEWTPRSND